MDNRRGSLLYYSCHFKTSETVASDREDPWAFTPDTANVDTEAMDNATAEIVTDSSAVGYKGVTHRAGRCMQTMNLSCTTFWYSPPCFQNLQYLILSKSPYDKVKYHIFQSLLQYCRSIGHGPFHQFQIQVVETFRFHICLQLKIFICNMWKSD